MLLELMIYWKGWGWSIFVSLACFEAFTVLIMLCKADLFAFISVILLFANFCNVSLLWWCVCLSLVAWLTLSGVFWRVGTALWMLRNWACTTSLGSTALGTRAYNQTPNTSTAISAPARTSEFVRGNMVEEAGMEFYFCSTLSWRRILQGFFLQSLFDVCLACAPSYPGLEREEIQSKHTP